MEVDYLSFTRIDTFLTCPRKFGFYLDEKKKKDEVKVSVVDVGPRDLGSTLHDTLEEFFGYSVERRTETNLFECFKKCSKLYSLSWNDYKDGESILKEWFIRSKDQFNVSVVALEKEFNVDIGDGVHLVGVWDRVDSPGKGVYNITDYKSGRMPMSKYDVDHSLQLGMYNLAARLVYPDAKRVVTVYDFLRMQRVSSEMNLLSLESLRDYLKGVYIRMKETKDPKAIVSSECKWCDYRYKCKDFQDVVVNQNISLPRAEPGDLDGLLNELDSLKRTKDSIGIRIDEIEDFLKEDLIMRDLQQMDHGMWTIRLFSSQRTYYDLKSIQDIFGRRNMLNEVLSVRKTEVDKLLKHITLTPEEEKDLLMSCRFSRSKPSVKIEKKKGEFI